MEDCELAALVLALVAEQRYRDARVALAGSSRRTSSAASSLDALVDFLAGGELAEHDLLATGTPEEELLAAAVLLLGSSTGVRPEPPTDGLPELAGRVDPADCLGALGRYLAVEAALATARIGLAEQLRALPGPDPHEVWSTHPFAPVMLACSARADVFGGNISAALAATAGSHPAGVPGDLLRATRAVAAGNAADVATMRALVEEVLAAGTAPVDRLGRGVHLLLAFSVIALGDARGAVARLLAAGTDADLGSLTVIDRVLGYELFVAAAVDEDDLGSAEGWEARARRWEGHRAAAPTVSRIRSRVALLAGDVDAAETHADDAVRLAGAEGRTVERAEGEIVRARARIAAQRVSAATRDLRAAVAAGDDTGFGAVRHAATRVLRPARRRLPPPTGSGWDSLSPREQDVAELILAGADNAQIADRLHLSRATVRTHATRVLAAYGVATRIGLLAATRAAPSAPQRPQELTARQAEVAALVAVGRSNPEVAQQLGIGVKSVERHVTEILQRWDVRTRFDLAHRWWGTQV